MDRHRHIVVIGCGNTGSHLLPHLARTPGIARLTLVDPDDYDSGNIKAQNIDPFDVERPKVLVQAAKLRRINPNLDAAAIHDYIQDVPRGLLQSELLVSCLDSKGARLYVNQIAWRLGIPWIDCGILGSLNLARVNAYVPSLNAPCFECPWGQEEYALVEQEYPCTAGSGAGYPTMASSALGALAASLAAIEVAKLLSGDLSASAAGKQVVVDAQHHSLTVSNTQRNAACRFDHRIWSIEPWQCRPECTTVGDVLSALGSLQIEGHHFVCASVCPACGLREQALRLNRPLARCTDCGHRLVTPGFPLERLDGELNSEYRKLKLAQIGVRVGDIVSAGDRHYLITEAA